MANRMAGSDEFKQELSRAEQNKLTRERIGNDPDRLAERISGVDREKYDFTGYSDKEINMALQGSTFGDEDYARLTGGKNPVDEVVEDTPETTDPVKPAVNIDFGDGGVNTAPASPPPSFMPEVMAPSTQTNTQTQTVYQDNDQQSSIVGDGNTVTQNQDNSVSQNGRYAQRGQLFKDDFMKAYF